MIKFLWFGSRELFRTSKLISNPFKKRKMDSIIFCYDEAACGCCQRHLSTDFEIFTFAFRVFSSISVSFPPPPQFLEYLDSIYQDFFTDLIQNYLIVALLFEVSSAAGRFLRPDCGDKLSTQNDENLWKYSLYTRDDCRKVEISFELIVRS